MLDRFVLGKAALVIAFIWGLAEATVFFLVPDVLLTLIACRLLRPAIRASIAALAGALIGGAMMYLLGRWQVETARALLDLVPAVNRDLIERVQSQIINLGPLSILIGPLKGIPYKIYAVEWAASGGGIVPFLLISVPARYIRFFLASAGARGIARAIQPFTKHKAKIEIAIVLLLWTVFYIFYFRRFGF